MSETIASITPPTSPEPDRYRPRSSSAATATLSRFEESLLDYYLGIDEKDAVAGASSTFSTFSTSSTAGPYTSPHGVTDADTMHFSDLRKNSVLTHRRQSMASTAALTESQADLSSRDRNKQKDAIRRILSNKVKNDWKWDWPQDASNASTSILDQYFDDAEETDWAEREEWTSGVSESDPDQEAKRETTATAADGASTADSGQGNDPFRFDSPGDVGGKVQQTEYAREEARRSRRWKRAQEEILTNDGLRCFTQRRDAWTNARYVRPLSTRPRRPSSVSIMSSPPPTPPPKDRPVTYMDAAREPLTQEEAAAFFDYMTAEVPIAKPILPPETPMRKGINEKAYPTIYDKVVVQGQTPFCPINLSVVTKSCVAGWKRDGEWPPKQAEPEPLVSRRPPPRPPRQWNGWEIPTRSVEASRIVPARPPEAERGARPAGDLGGRPMAGRRGDAKALSEKRSARDILEEAAATNSEKDNNNGEKAGKNVLRRSLQKVFDVVHHRAE